MLLEKWGQRLKKGLLVRIAGSARARHILWSLLFFALTGAIFAVTLVPQQLAVQVGDPSPADVYSPRTITNQAETTRLRQEAADRVPPIYRASPAVQRQAEEEVGRAFSEVQRIRSMAGVDEAQRLERLRQSIPGLPDESLRAVLRSSEANLVLAERGALDALRDVLALPISSGVVDTYRARVDALIDAAPGSDLTLKLFAKDIARPQVRPNLEVDVNAMSRKRQEAADAVPDQVIKQGEKVVRKGERVTAAQMALLSQLGLVGQAADVRVVTGSILFALLLVALVVLYLERLRPDIVASDRKILLVGICGTSTLLLTLLARSWQAYLIPIALGPMLLSILLDARMAIMLGITLSLGVGATSPGDLTGVLTAAAGAIVGAYALERTETRGQVLRAGLIVGVAQALTTLAAMLVRGRTIGIGGGLAMQQWWDVGLGLVSGVAAAIGCIGMLPLFEGAFGVLTPLKLLELSNPNHPLLRKLLVEAPGSYHHTILVANLCEAAADAIGADRNLSRVGAYFHDIGKAKRPYFFIENQFGGENPHDKLPPSLSAMIIAGHVKDGVEMAREHKLPPEIIRFISEHHGTMLITYFYNKANESGQSEYVVEDDFRYDGPKPGSRETAILMLADGCEATVRVLHQRGNLTGDMIEQVVRKIINDRLAQGQLSEAPLTLQDLDVIGRTFLRVLSGVHHARIEYPGSDILPEAGKANGADLGDGRPGQGTLPPRAGAAGAEGGGAGA